MPLDERFKGVGAALITPFDEHQEIDYAGLKRLIEFVSEGGVDYLVVQGTTGESPTISSTEKDEILAFSKKHNIKGLPIMYGLGGNDTRAVLETILELAQHPNIIGIKDAGGSIEQSMELAAHAPKDFLLLSGDDNLVTTMVSVGWHGVISVIANGFPREFTDLTWHALEGNFKEAAALQLAFLEFDTLLYIESNPVGIKKCLEIKGVCSSEVRLPLLKATAQLGEKLEAAMKREGFI